MGERSEQSLIFADTDSGGIIHIANIKGGVGKSTVATNLAAAFSRQGPTLLIDLDVQGSATVALGRSVESGSLSSWELMRRRFCPCRDVSPETSSLHRFRSTIDATERKLFGSIIGSGSIQSLILQVQPGLDLIPAGPALFRTASSFQIANLRFNLALCREYYKYIILDTPSVWNNLTRMLYLASDLNLIPVTLNALSTKSLRDYLTNVRNLARECPRTRLRIVKNEVFGKQDSKLVGKTRTMNENRRFLENLCEQVTFSGGKGISILPQSIMFDLEIPESAIIRNAQDEGLSVYQYQQYGKMNKAFDELAKRVQCVLNTPSDYRRSRSLDGWVQSAVTLAACLIAVLLFGLHPEVTSPAAPRPVAPQALMVPTGGVFVHTFRPGESIHKLAKYAICRFRAKVPSFEQVNEYIDEVVMVHNFTRREGETRIKGHSVPPGVTLTFYPPMAIDDEEAKRLLPVYTYFMEMVDDSFPYITGDWCERGTGGGQPHYGIDVAGASGARIIAPIDGVAALTVNSVAGRTLGIINDKTIIFFCHLDKRFFRDGDYIKKGQVIGTIGMTGRSSGPHVHIGYGIRSQSRGDMKIGGSHYRITDPKLFFYREMYFGQVASAQ